MGEDGSDNVFWPAGAGEVWWWTKVPWSWPQAGDGEAVRQRVVGLGAQRS